MLNELVVEDFAPLIGTRLAVGNAELEVKEVRALNSPSPRQHPSFALLLRDVGAAQSMAQGIYRVRHPARGELDLFIVPIGPDGSGMCYEVIFN